MFGSGGLHQDRVLPVHERDQFTSKHNRHWVLVLQSFCDLVPVAHLHSYEYTSLVLISCEFQQVRLHRSNTLVTRVIAGYNVETGLFRNCEATVSTTLHTPYSHSTSAQTHTLIVIQIHMYTHTLHKCILTHTHTHAHTHT